MARCVWLILLSLGFIIPGSFAQDGEIGVIVLKDGREIPIEGQIEVFGDEVQFQKDGAVMVLSVDRVDLDATDRRNQELAEAASTHSFSSDGNTLADQVEAWKQSGGEVKKPEIIVGKDVNRQQEPLTDAEDFQQKLEALQQELQQGDFSRVESFLESIPDTAKYLFLGTIFFLGLTGLIAFVTQIYVLFTSFSYSPGMGWALVLVWGGSIVTSFIGGITLNPLLSIASFLLGIATPILFIVHIVKDRFGSRLKLLTLMFFLPIFASLLLVGVMFFALMSGV